MSQRAMGIMLAEPEVTYTANTSPRQWVEVLVDYADLQDVLTYQIPPELSVQPGDIVSVPLRSQVVGGIAIRLRSSPPPDLDPQRIRPVEEVIAAGFFPPSYWQLCDRVAQYYYTPLINVIRGALPPGLLGRSQRRIRLQREALPTGAEAFCSPPARAILERLCAQPQGDYSARYLQRQVKGAKQGLRELLKRGWVKSYLEPPKLSRPKQQKVVTWVADADRLTERQQEVLDVLRRRGGELGFNQLLQISQASSSVIEALARKGCVAIQEREVLRLASDSTPERDRPKSLTAAQTQALEVLTNLEEYAEVLLHGVTGSGKTEVYLQAIAPILARGKSALVLVPEIGLTPQLCDRFRARFGNKVCVYHSALSDGERYDTWRQMLTGEPQVTIGTRSAIFSPLPNLGLIVLDEEHDSSFKQTHLTPTYHTRTVARWRAEIENCPLVLGSATPALETWTRLANSPQPPHPNTYYLSLPERIQSRPLPPVEIVDMRQELRQGNRSIFSRSLQSALERLQARGQQGILFIPRRGHSTFVSCRSCGYVMECPDCDVSLSYHYTHAGATPLLRCHYCNYTQLQPPCCPACSSPYLKHFGSGTQRVIQELGRQFPQLRPLRFDSDTTRAKGSHRALLTRFANGEADLLVGTQMLTKGLDIAQVTLVGVVAADGLLHRCDYSAAERAFQTLAQVAGRAGRGDDPGQVMIQTYSPTHPVLQAVREHDYERFATAELATRAAHNYPPCGRLILLQLMGLDEQVVQQSAQAIAQRCKEKANAESEVLGPAPARVMRVARRYRWQILLKFPPQVETTLPDFSELRALCPRSVNLLIDVDPIALD